MRKFFSMLKVTLNSYLAYRLNFVLWRVRTMFSLLLLYFLWTQVFVGQREVADYTKPMILTYIFLANFLNAVVLSSKTDQISGEIRNGGIINLLLKPVPYFLIVASREIVDKLMNIAFSIVEIIIFALIFRPEFFIQTNPVAILAFIGFVLLALLLSFYISLGLALIAFWTSEIWAPRFIFMIFISLIAGTLFPLDIFPKQYYDIFLMTPFPYLVYVPAYTFINGITDQTAQFAINGIAWLIVVITIAILMWKKGLKDFEFFGR